MFRVCLLTSIPATTVVMVSRSYPRDDPVLDPASIQDAGGWREDGPTALFSGSARAIQGGSGPTRPAGSRPAPPPPGLAAAVPAPASTEEAAGGKGRFFHRNPPPTFPQPHPPVSADSPSIRGGLQNRAPSPITPLAPITRRAKTHARLHSESQLTLRFGWGGRIRTYDTRYQKPLPYHLATPQQYAPSALTLWKSVVFSFPKLQLRTGSGPRFVRVCN